MSIDRISPTRRPSLPIAGTQQWRSLLFMHWPVPVDRLRPLVPAALELDLFDGVAYVGLVPFAMRQIRSVLWPRFIAFNFLETNVRVYVHHHGRPGVFFLSLDASSWLAVQGARIGWNLPYHFASMATQADGDRIQYQSRRRRGGASLDVCFEPAEHLGPSPPGTLEHFLLERYLLFVQRRGQVLVGQVHHSPYPAQLARVIDVHDSLVAASGLPAADGLPPLAHYAAGVDVEVFSLQRTSKTESDDPTEFSESPSLTSAIKSGSYE